MPTSLFTDDFNRTNENPLAGNWTTGSGLSALQLSGNAVGGSAVASCGAYVNSVTPNADQYAQCSLTPATAAGITGGGVAVRMSTGAVTYYGLQMYGGTNPVTLDLFKESAGSYSSLNATTVTYSQGDVIRIEAEGTALRGYVNGVLKVSATDSSIASGRLGLVSFTDTGIRYDNYDGGNLSASFQAAWARNANTVISSGAK